MSGLSREMVSIVPISLSRKTGKRLMPALPRRWVLKHESQMRGE